MQITSLIPYFTYYLALQKCHHNSNYTLHGLWIDYSKGGYPQFCNNTAFDPNELLPIYKNLNRYWGSCYGSNEGLWEHEWKKHGTCFSPAFSLKEYFNKTLHLYFKTNTHNCQHKDCLIAIDSIDIYN